MSTTSGADSTVAQGDAMSHDQERRNREAARLVAPVMEQVVFCQEDAVRNHLQSLGSHLLQGSETMYAISNDFTLWTGPYLCDSEECPVLRAADGKLADKYPTPLWWKEGGVCCEVGPMLMKAFGFACEGLVPLLEATALDYNERRKSQMNAQWSNGRAAEVEAQRTVEEGRQFTMRQHMQLAKENIEKEVQLRSAAQRETSRLREEDSELKRTIQNKLLVIDTLNRKLDSANKKCEDAEREAADATQKRDEMANELQHLKEERAREQDERMQQDIAEQQQLVKEMKDIWDEVGRIVALYTQAQQNTIAAYAEAQQTSATASAEAQQRGDALYAEAQQRFDALVNKLKPNA